MFLLLIFIIFFICIFAKVFTRENYDENDYNYDEENPNALVTGKNIAGTVYASKEDIPGLGWII